MRKTKEMVLVALFTALVTVATMIIRIPTPGTNGYIHPGDAMVILAGIILGKKYGFMAAGTGSALADLLGGYLTYAPITFIIKGLVALFSAIAYHKIGKTKKLKYIGVIIGGIGDVVLVVGGYLLFEVFIYGAGAIASVPANFVQGMGGLVIAVLLYPVLSGIPDIKSRL